MTPTGLPDWAIERALAALSLGMKVPEVEQQLVAKGLTPTQANAVVMSVLEGHVRANYAPMETEDGGGPIELVLSLVVAGLCLALVYWFGGSKPLGWTVVCIVPGLAGIWFPVMMRWEWGLSRGSTRAFGWLWLLLFGISRVVLVALSNRAV